MATPKKFTRFLQFNGLIELIRQLHKKHSKRQLGVLENLYSDTFYRFAAPFLSILQRPHSVTLHITHKA
jgi:hypothetical protein